MPTISRTSTSHFRYKRISVVTGVSGSGKSSLLLDTLAAEGSRRTRIFLDMSQQDLERDDVRAFIGRASSYDPRRPARISSQRAYDGWHCDRLPLRSPSTIRSRVGSIFRPGEGKCAAGFARVIRRAGSRSTIAVPSRSGLLPFGSSGQTAWRREAACVPRNTRRSSCVAKRTLLVCARVAVQSSV